MECVPGDSDRIIREAHEVVSHNVMPVKDGWIAVISVRLKPQRTTEELIHWSPTEERARAWLEAQVGAARGVDTMSIRVMVLSDVHCEFHHDDGRSFVESLDPSGVDVLVLAGDTSNTYGIVHTLEQFCKKFPIVITVLGNHEWYGTSTSPTRTQKSKFKPGGTLGKLRDLEERTPNLRVLDDQITEVDGVVFAGSTLWFRNDSTNTLYEQCLADFVQIKSFTPWVYDSNRRSEQFLQGVLAHEGSQRVDVVITHHLPSMRCVTPQYMGNTLNRFFVAPVADELPPEHLPALWIYGHTHDPADFEHSGCRFLCNAFGYPFESKDEFREKLVVRVKHRVVSLIT